MKPIKLSLRNFCSYKDEEIDFSDLQQTCIIAPTGSGKSFLVFDSISYAIFEKTRKKDNASLIRHGEDSMSVELEFVSSKGEDVKIVRSIEKSGKRSASSLSLYIEGAVTPLKHKKDLQEKLIEIIGMDYESFTNSVLLMQGGAGDFFNMAKSQQTTFLIDLFSVNRFLKYSEKAKEKKSELQKTATILEYECEKFESLKTALQDLANSIKFGDDKVDCYKKMIRNHGREKESMNNDLGLLEEYESCLTGKRDAQASLDLIRVEKNEFMKNIEKQAQEFQDLKKSSVEKMLIKISEKDLLIKSNKSAILSKKNELEGLGDTKKIQSRLQELELHNSDTNSSIRVAQNTMKDELFSVDKGITILSGSIDGVSGEISSITKAGALLKNAVEEIEKRIKRIPACPKCGHKSEDLLKMLQDDKLEKDAEIKEMRKEYLVQTELLKSLQKKKCIEDNKLESIRLEHKEKIDSLMEKIVSETKIRKLESDILKSKSLEQEIFQKVVDVERLTSEIASIHKDIEVEKHKTNDIHSAEKNAIFNEKIRVAEEAIKKYPDNMQVPNTKFSSASELKNAISEVDNKMESLNISMLELQESLAINGSEKNRIQNEIDLCKKYKSDLDVVTSDINALSMMQRMCSRTGIPLQMLNSYLGQVSNKINSILHKVADFTISFNTVKEKKDGAMSEELNVIIHTNGYNDSFECLSGGQKSILRLAFMLTISEIISTIHGNAGGFLALDEAIVGLDIDTELAICEMLSSKLSGLECFWVISHSPQVQSLFNNILRIEKVDGISKISQ